MSGILGKKRILKNIPFKRKAGKTYFNNIGVKVDSLNILIQILDSVLLRLGATCSSAPVTFKVLSEIIGSAKYNYLGACHITDWSGGIVQIGYSGIGSLGMENVSWR